MSRIGLFGGTFDPLHIGHLVLAQEAHFQLGLDRVLWILTPNPPHKPQQHITPPGSRKEMLSLEVDIVPEFSISDVELKREAPHYTFHTVQILRESLPGDELLYLLGGDSLRDLPNWYRARELVEILDGIGVMLRPNADIDLSSLDQKLPGLEGKIHLIETPLIEISSSDIRRRIRSREPFRYFLPLSVYRYICNNRLYLEGEG